MSSVSVVIPCYNYARYLDECVASVLSQQGVEVSVLVVDDASTDDTAAVAAAWARRDPRVQVRRHAVNAGHIATYNEGLEWASGDYTALVSADDLLTPGSLGRAAAFLDAHPTAAFVYGRAVPHVDGTPLPRLRTGTARWHRWDGRRWIARRCRTAMNVICSPEVVVRTSVQHAAGGYRADLPYSGDLEMWLRLAAHGDVGHLRGVDQALYRQHRASMTLGYDVLAVSRARLDAVDAFLAAGLVPADEARALRAASRRTVGRQALAEACLAYDRPQAHGAPVAPLVALAESLLDGGVPLRFRWALAWRARLGPERASRLRPVVLTPAVRRRAAQWRTRRAAWRGV